MRLIKNKGFTLIELLVTIAVLGVLVLLGIPKFTSYIQEAELTRIQHDVRVMEEEIKIILIENEKIEGFDYNTKDLGLLIEANRLFEKEGHAEVLEYVPAKGEINGLNSKERKVSSKANVGGVEYSTYEGLGVGGDEIQIGEEEFKEMYERYKIVPDEYTDKIKTRLKGTFYTNDNGKVYYEPDKQNKIKTEPKVLNCDVALPDYEFKQETGKIIKYIGTEKHLIIPSHFLVDDECVPVRVIGEGAFMQGGFKSIMIPPSVLVIGGNAFKDSGVDSIYIPGSVRKIGQGAFDDIEEVVYLGGPSRVNNGSGPGTYLAPNGAIKNIVHRYPSASEAAVVFHPESGTIVRGSNKGSIPEYIHVDGRDVRVRKVAKGAYQGLGLTTVELPETLEVIEDYAFSGNQLIGVTIPNSVYHIGNYAFSFNEVWHKDNGNDRKATIKTVIIKGEEQFKKIDEVGNIAKDGIKVNLLEAGSSELGPNVKLLNHIWVTSIGNIVIDVKYGPVGSGSEGIPEGYEMADLEDFEFVPNSSAPNEYHGNKGYYRYVGNKEYVIIPHIIQDVKLKDYYRMFEGSNSNVKGVASDNKNVTDMSWMFYGSASTPIELKHLDTSSVTDMSNMFYNSNTTTLDLNSFDTSSVTNMNRMFYGSQATTLDLSSFDTSSVTNMGDMFYNSQATTLDLSSFDTSSVTSMPQMFRESKATTLDLSSFDTSSVTNTIGMFLRSQATIGYARTAADAGKFNTTDNKPKELTFVVKGDLDKPQPPTNKPDGYVIAKQEDFQFIVSNGVPNSYNGTKGYYKYVGADDKVVVPHMIHGNEIKDYYRMFAGSNVKGVASDNKNVTNMSNMFDGSTSTSIELKYLDTSSVISMGYMFQDSKATTLDLSSFDTSSVTNMYQMFYNSQASTLDLSSFDTSSVTTVYGLFNKAQATTGYARTAADAGKFNTTDNKPKELTFVVKGDLDKPQPPTNKPDGYVIAKQEDFQFIVSNGGPNLYNGTKGYYSYVGADDKIVVPHIIHGNEIKDYYRMFAGSNSNVKGVASDNKNVTNMSNMFDGSTSTSIELKYLDTSSVIDMNRMFYNSKATKLGLSSFDTSSVTDMSYMFYNSQTTTLDLSSFDTSSVTNMGEMFYNAQASTLDLSSFDTSKVTSTNRMFYNSNATTGYARTAADAGKFNTTVNKPRSLTFVVKGDLDKPQPSTNKPDGYVIAKQEDFQFVVNSGAPNLYNGTKGYYTYVGSDDKIVIPHIIHGNEIKDYYKMFESSNVKGVASDNKNVSDMSWMFYSSTSTSIELKYLDTSSVISMGYMFQDSKATTLDLSSFDTSSVTNMYQMFRYSQVTTLDLSSFDTLSVTTMYYMFYGSKATAGYARTAEDAHNFNTKGSKPSTLTFVVK